MEPSLVSDGWDGAGGQAQRQPVGFNGAVARERRMAEASGAVHEGPEIGFNGAVARERRMGTWCRCSGRADRGFNGAVARERRMGSRRDVFTRTRQKASMEPSLVSDGWSLRASQAAAAAAGFNGAVARERRMD